MEPAPHHPLNPGQFDGWLPVDVYARGDGLLVEWNRLDGERLHEPFFADSCARLRRRPFNILFSRQTRIDDLVDLAPSRPGLPPTGFIFHASRCGSTLVAQMLCALSRNVVLSEPSPIDALLRFRRGDPAISLERRATWLRAMVSALGQATHPGAEQVFIKFDSWSIFELPLISAAFPSVPWIFLYRDPLEILASHMHHRGMHMVPGVVDPGLFGVTREQAIALSPEDYCALVLGRVCGEAARHIAAHGGLAINYAQLPQALETTLAAWFGVEWNQAERIAFREAARRNAKHPASSFSPDQAQKRNSASPALHAAVARWVAQSYCDLEHLSHPISA